MSREHEAQTLDEEDYYWLNEHQLKMLRDSLHALREIDISKTDDKTEGKIFLVVGDLHLVISQIDGTFRSY